MIAYTDITSYKYMLMEDYEIDLKPWGIVPGDNAFFTYFQLYSNGTLAINKHYTWDGPSGPTIDTKDSLEGSLVHDALYELMRLAILPLSYRENADQVLHDLLERSGMNSIRADCWYEAVRLAAAGAAEPNGKPEIEILYA